MILSQILRHRLQFANSSGLGGKLEYRYSYRFRQIERFVKHTINGGKTGHPRYLRGLLPKLLMVVDAMVTKEKGKREERRKKKEERHIAYFYLARRRVCVILSFTSVLIHRLLIYQKKFLYIYK